MKKIKILFVQEYFSMGGAEQHLENLSRGLDKRFECEFLALKTKEAFGKEFEKAGFRVHELRMNDLSNPLMLIKNVRKFKRAVKKIAPDVITTQLWAANFIGRMANLDIPLVAVEQNISIDRALQHKLADRFLLGREARLVSISESIVDYNHKHSWIPKEKFTVILNGINIDRFKTKRDIRKKLGLGKKDIVLINLASLTKQKGQHLLLDAVSEVRRKFPIRLLIVGTGNLEAKLKKQAEELGLLADKTVIFTGRRRDISDILHSSDIFVFSSLWEGLPNALMEGMACNLPVVAFDVEGTKELVDNGVTGILIEKGDVEQFTKDISRLAANASLRKKMGAEGRKKVEEFTISKMVDAYTRIYLDILKK